MICESILLILTYEPSVGDLGVGARTMLDRFLGDECDDEVNVPKAN
jgi:hypothetical protein